ncbi:MAG: alpha/beta fold hydrolase [Candidatus Helarchaeota archaeon]
MLKIPTFKTKDDVEIYYQVEGEGEPLLLIMGLGTKMTGWRLQIQYFKKRGMKVIAYDARGVGKSSRPDYPYTMEMFVNDAIELIDNLGIDRKIHLCGISMGGMVAQHFALQYPERLKTLILLATTSKTNVKPLIENIKMMEQMDEDQKIKSMMAVLFSREFYKKAKNDKNFYETYKKDMLTDPTRVEDYINQSKAIQNHDTIDKLHKIEIPTLVIAGTKDLLLPPRHSKVLHKNIPNSELRIIEGVGHALTMEAADKINPIIMDFINKNK